MNLQETDITEMIKKGPTQQKALIAAGLLAQGSEQFFNCSKKLETALIENDTNNIKLNLDDLVQHIDRINMLVGVISSNNKVTKKKAIHMKKMKLSLKKDPKPKEQTPLSHPSYIPPPPPPPPLSSSSPVPTLSTTKFLQQLEILAVKFAQDNSTSIDVIWKPILMQALPDHEVSWVVENLNDTMSWDTAKRAFLQQFSDEAIREETKQQAITSRQERYLEYLLELKMKEFDSIGDYNQKFGKYALAAGMDLSDPKLIERYMRSLVPHYAHKLKNALDANERPVRLLKDAMDLADHSKRPPPVTSVYISPQSCDGSPEDQGNNNNKLSYF